MRNDCKKVFAGHVFDTKQSSLIYANDLVLSEGIIVSYEDLYKNDDGYFLHTLDPGNIERIKPFSRDEAYNYIRDVVSIHAANMLVPPKGYK